MRRINLLIVFLFLFLLGFCYAQDECSTRCCDEEYPKLVVQGHGKIETLADKVYFNIRIRSEEKKLDKAFESGTKKINSIYEAVSSYGVKKEDIKNLGYIYHPLYEGKKIFTTIDRPTSYEIVYNLKITIYDLDNLGKLLVSLAEIPEISIYGFEYTSTKIDELKRQVLKEAGADAYQKASKLAEGAHAVLGKAVKIETSAQAYNLRRYGSLMQEAVMFDKAKNEIPVPQLESGYLEIEGDCVVYYAIQ